MNKSLIIYQADGMWIQTDSILSQKFGRRKF